MAHLLRVTTLAQELQVMPEVVLFSKQVVILQLIMPLSSGTTLNAVRVDVPVPFNQVVQTRLFLIQYSKTTAPEQQPVKVGFMVVWAPQFTKVTAR